MKAFTALSVLNAELVYATGTTEGIHLDNPHGKRLSTPQLIVMAGAISCRVMAPAMTLERLLKIIAREIIPHGEKRRLDRKF